MSEKSTRPESEARRDEYITFQENNYLSWLGSMIGTKKEGSEKNSEAAQASSEERKKQ